MIREVIICIPVYNSESTLEETLNSLVNQSYPIAKIKIFNNASTDKSEIIISKFQKEHSNIEHYLNDVNIGGEANFTRCIQASEGDYCLVAHADDVYHQNFIKNTVDILEKNPAALAVFTKACIINEKSERLSPRFFPVELMKNKVTQLNFDELYSLVLKYANFITCPGVIVRSYVFQEKIKIWNGEKFKTSADLDVWLRIAEIGPIVSLNEELINYRASEASYSFRIAKRRVNRHDMFLVLDFYKEKYREKLSNDNFDDYKFLLQKDQALVSLNKMRNGDLLIKNDLYEIYLFNSSFKSFWHFKFSLAIIGVRVLACLYSIFKGIKDA